MLSDLPTGRDGDDAEKGPRRGKTWRHAVLPFALVLIAPPTVLLLWIAAVRFDGSIVALLRADLGTIAASWPAPSLAALAIVVGWALFQLALLRGLPGPEIEGPFTPEGNRPRYRDNGVLAWLVTHAVFVLGAFHWRWFSPSFVYESFGSILATLGLLAFVLCLVLYVKGRYRPSTTDAGSTGNPVWDFFWGMELHPRAFGVELKQWLNSRVAMMGWSILVISFAGHQADVLGRPSNAMMVSCVLQVAYVFKFFFWERGYFHSLDITHDRFGFYLCWGVLSWLPGVYTITVLYLVNHPGALGATGVVLLLGLGATAMWINYDADAQRQHVRATAGNTLVWGKKPRLITAEYRTRDGALHHNLLLASGWWGLARHFHYLPELCMALAWSLPAGFDRALPYFYASYLAVLLFDRSKRDERRCSAKYGAAWAEYSRLVPYRVVPHVY